MTDSKEGKKIVSCSGDKEDFLGLPEDKAVKLRKICDEIWFKSSHVPKDVNQVRVNFGESTLGQLKKVWYEFLNFLEKLFSSDFSRNSSSIPNIFSVPGQFNQYFFTPNGSNPFRPIDFKLPTTPSIPFGLFSVNADHIANYDVKVANTFLSNIKQEILENKDALIKYSIRTKNLITQKFFFNSSKNLPLAFQPIFCDFGSSLLSKLIYLLDQLVLDIYSKDFYKIENFPEEFRSVIKDKFFFLNYVIIGEKSFKSKEVFDFNQFKVELSAIYLVDSALTLNQKLGKKLYKEFVFAYIDDKWIDTSDKSWELLDHARFLEK